MVRISYYESSFKRTNTTVVQSDCLFVGTYLDYSKPSARLEIQRILQTVTYLRGSHREWQLSVMTTVTHCLSLFSCIIENVSKENRWRSCKFMCEKDYLYLAEKNSQNSF